MGCGKMGGFVWGEMVGFSVGKNVGGEGGKVGELVGLGELRGRIRVLWVAKMLIGVVDIEGSQRGIQLKKRGKRQAPYADL